MKKSLKCLITSLLVISLISCSSEKKDKSEESSSFNSEAIDYEVTIEEFDNVLTTNLFSVDTEASIEITRIINGETTHAAIIFDNGIIYLDGFLTNNEKEYIEIFDDGTVIHEYLDGGVWKGGWKEQSIPYNNETIGLFAFSYNDFSFNKEENSYYAPSVTITMDGDVTFENIYLKFENNKIMHYEFEIPKNSLSFEADCSYEKQTLKEEINERKKSFHNHVFKCVNVISEHPDLESLKKVYIDTTIQLFNDESLEFVLSEDELDLRVIVGTYIVKLHDDITVLSFSRIYQNKHFYPYGGAGIPYEMIKNPNDNTYQIIIRKDSYDLCLIFESTSLTPAPHELIEEEEPDINKYLIEESVWEDIINGSMTSRDSNYTCHMYKSMIEIENTSTQDFYVDDGNLKRSYPASFDETLIIDEIYELVEWGAPTSSYYHYTYNRNEEQWYYEDLNSKYSIFYLYDLGIVIDLSYSELSFNEDKNCYECSHKKSYPYDSQYSYEIYDDIEIYFEKNLLKEIKYVSSGANWTFTFDNYDNTSITIPVNALKN